MSSIISRVDTPLMRRAAFVSEEVFLRGLQIFRSMIAHLTRKPQAENNPSIRLTEHVIPKEKIFFFDMELPSLSRSHIKSAIRLQIDEISPFPVHDLAWTFLTMPKPQSKTFRVCIAMMRASELRDFIANASDTSSRACAFLALNDQSEKFVFHESFAPVSSKTLKPWLTVSLIAIAIVACLNAFATRIEKFSAKSLEHEAVLSNEIASLRASIEDANRLEALQKHIEQQLSLSDLTQSILALSSTAPQSLRTKELVVSQQRVQFSGFRKITDRPSLNNSNPYSENTLRPAQGRPGWIEIKGQMALSTKEGEQ